MVSLSQKSKVASLLSQTESLIVFKILFEHFCINGHRPTDKQLRNEILILCNETVKYGPPDVAQKLIETEFIETLCLFMMYVELGIEHPDVNHLIMTQESEDYEFKKIILEISKTLCLKSDEALKIFMQNGLIQYCLVYLDFDARHPILNHWTPHQLRGLQLQILGFLLPVLPSIFEDLKNANISAILVDYLKMIKIPEDVKKVLTFTPRETMGLIKACLQLILNISEISIAVKKSFGPLGVFDILIGESPAYVQNQSPPPLKFFKINSRND
jgi:hypothetical protein